MFKSIKRALVDSYVGAIGLGYLLAQVILYFIRIFSVPVASWIAEKRAAQFMSRPAIYTGYTGLPLQSALTELINFALLLFLWYILLRWLYLERPAKETSAPVTDQERPA